MHYPMTYNSYTYSRIRIIRVDHIGNNQNEKTWGNEVVAEMKDVGKAKKLGNGWQRVVRDTAALLKDIRCLSERHLRCVVGGQK